MAEKELRTRISLRRDSEDILKAKNPLLLKGEIFLVDTEDGLKVKVGDGTSSFNKLDYQEYLTRGYLLGGKFYTDSTYSVEIEPTVSKLYLDINADKQTKYSLYYWDGAKFIVTNGENIATDTVAGITKLYDYAGNNTDGAITQRAATELAKNGIIDEDDEILFLTNIDLDNMYVEKHGIK